MWMSVKLKQVLDRIEPSRAHGESVTERTKVAAFIYWQH